MENIVDLNKLLKERAQKKLTADINNYLNAIREGIFFKEIQSLNVTLGDSKPCSMREWSWPSSGPAFYLLVEKCLPQYIEDESKAFIEKVESIRQDVDNLLSNTDY